MFKNLKIGMRLGLGFGIVLLLMAILSIIGYSRVQMLNQEMDDMVKDKFPKTIWANDIIENVNIVARSARNVLLIKNPDEVKKEFERITEARKVVSERFAQLEKTITSEAGKKLIADALNLRKEFIADLDKFADIARSGKTEEATAHLLSEVRKSQLDYMTSINKLTDFQTDLMKQAGEQADKAADQAATLILTLALAAFVIGIGFAIWVTRSITQPVNEAVAAANALAEGDLTVRIDVQGKDEVGQLMAAMQAPAKTRYSPAHSRMSSCIGSLSSTEMSESLSSWRAVLSCSAAQAPRAAMVFFSFTGLPPRSRLRLQQDQRRLPRLDLRTLSAG